MFDRGYAAGVAFSAECARRVSHALVSRAIGAKARVSAELLANFADGLEQAFSEPAPAEPDGVVEVALVKSTAVSASSHAEALARGYTGDVCGECGNLTIARNGNCLKCDTCGATSGCS